jgi:hypothetical protein
MSAHAHSITSTATGTYPPEIAILIAVTERSDVADHYRDRVLSGLLTYWRNDARDDFLTRDRSFEA